jgi:hypothetical protein
MNTTTTQTPQYMINQPAGWYPDPLSPRVIQRRWDGARWTTDLQPAPNAPESVRNSTITYPNEEIQTLEPPPSTQLLLCSDCGGKVSIHAPVCVHCGRPNEMHPTSPTTSSDVAPSAPPSGMVLTPTPGSNLPQSPSDQLTPPPARDQASAQNSRNRQSSKSRDIPAIVTLILGVTTLILSVVAFQGAGITVMVVAALLMIATWVSAHKAKKIAEEAGEHRSWMVLVGKLLAFTGLVVLGFAVANLVMSVVASGTAALVP